MEEKINAIRKYNFWDEATPELGYYRTDYADKIFSYTGNKLVKILIGQRRTGKSYILRQLINKLINSGFNRKNILYINKEYTDFDFIVDYTDLEKFEVLPFSFPEYLGILTKESTKQNFIDYMESGGLPELFNLQNDEIKRNYVAALNHLFAA